jgi:vacuolar-type H+-ATPase subunit E/Vma4
MLKQRLSYLLFFVLLTAGFVSCSSVDKSNPKAVLQAFFDKIGQKDIDGAMKLATANSQSTLSMVKMAVEMAKDNKAAEKEDLTKDFKDIVLGEAKIEGDVATVPLTSKKEEKSVDFILKKEGGEWKVDFSFEALMKMGLNSRAKEEQRSGNDTLIEQFDEETIKKMSETADSIVKNMDPKKLEQLQKEGNELMKKYKEKN